MPSSLIILERIERKLRLRIRSKFASLGMAFNPSPTFISETLVPSSRGRGSKGATFAFSPSPFLTSCGIEEIPIEYLGYAIPSPPARVLRDLLLRNFGILFSHTSPDIFKGQLGMGTKRVLVDLRKNPVFSVYIMGTALDGLSEKDLV